MPSDSPAIAHPPGWLGKAALILTGAMSGVGNGTLSPILPQIETEFGQPAAR